MNTLQNNKTPEKEIHPEEIKRRQAAERLTDAKKGYLPDNQEIDRNISKMQSGLTKDSDKLSVTGKMVVNDINAILETTKDIIHTKNDGNILQNAYYHSNQVGTKKSYSERLQELKSITPGNQKEVRAEARKNVSSLSTIVKLALLSPEFRETINDISKITNQLLKKKSDKQKGSIDMSKEEREMRTAKEDIDKIQLEKDSEEIIAPPKEEEKVIFNPDTGILEEISKEPLEDPRCDRQTTIRSIGALDEGTAQPVEIVSKPIEKMPNQTMEKTTSTQTSSTTTTKERDFISSVERKREKEDKLIERIVELAETLHSHPEYRNSILYLSNSANKLKDISTTKKETIKEKREQDKNNEPSHEVQMHKMEARDNGKKFLENWIGYDYSLDPLLLRISSLYKASKKDPILRQLLQDWKQWSTSTVADSDYIADKQKVRADARDLVDRTKEIFSGPYHEESRVIRTEMNYINKCIQRDDAILQLRENFSVLSKDIIKDSQGNNVLKPELLTDAQIIFQNILESVRYIPLPPITRKTDDLEIQLSNIVLNTTDITPSNVRMIVQADTSKDWGNTRQKNNSFLIEISKIRAHLSSVNFYINKKTGFPKVEDRGLADIFLFGSKGLSLTIEVVPNLVHSGKHVHSIFTAKRVTCSISKLKIHLRETKHDFLYKLVAPVINRVATSKIENGISNYIRDNIEKMNTIVSSRTTNATYKTAQKVDEKSAPTENPVPSTTEPQLNPELHNPAPQPFVDPQTQQTSTDV